MIDKPIEISLDALLVCAKHELATRKRRYPQLVARLAMSPLHAKHEIACMGRIVEILDQMNGRLL